MRKLFLGFLLFLAACSQPAQKEDADAQAFAQKIQATPNVQLVDVRTPGEYAMGHLANAKLMDISTGAFEQGMGSLDKEKPVLVYCAVGGRSATAADLLVSAGFKNVINLAGGIVEWQQAGLPVTTE